MTSPAIDIGRPTVVIPSYWGRPSFQPFDLADDLYDHPTPIDTEGTLARALESFKTLKAAPSDYDIVCLAVATNEKLQEAAEERTKAIVEPFRSDLSVRVFSYGDLAWLHERLAQAGHDLIDLMQLRGYSNVRNACLVATILSGSDVAIFFDDDEIMVDPYYMTRATENLGTVTMGAPVFFVAGYYIRPEGDTYAIPRTTDWRDAEWRGTDFMNAAFAAISRPPRLKRTPFTFGGNMVVHRTVFSQCCFDPHVTRGEDIDYLMDAKMFGFEVFLDNELAIKHLPPAKHAPGWVGFRENVYRFVYQRTKLKSQKRMPEMRKVTLEELMPYPGAFLGPDLWDKIYKTCVLGGLDALAEGDETTFRRWMETIGIARFEAVPEFDPFDDYVERCARWRRLVKVLSTDSEAQARWRAGFP